MSEPKTLDEAIFAEELAREPAQNIRFITFDPPIMVTGLGRGAAMHSKFDPEDSLWEGWKALLMEDGIVLEHAPTGRKIAVSASRCVVETRPACPRCGAWLSGPKERCTSCTWPKAERRICPACRSRLKETAVYCIDPKCKYGQPDEPMAKEPEKKPEPTCAECGGRLVKGACVLGHKQAKEKKA
jgi:hypothetical protein